MKDLEQRVLRQILFQIGKNVDENCAVLGYYEANSYESLPIFRYLSLEMGAIILTETCCIIAQKSAVLK